MLKIDNFSIINIMNSVEVIYVAGFGDFEFNPDLIECLLFYMNSCLNDDQSRIVLMGDTVKPHDCDVQKSGTGHLTYTYEIAEKDVKFKQRNQVAAPVGKSTSDKYVPPMFK